MHKSKDCSGAVIEFLEENRDFLEGIRWKNAVYERFWKVSGATLKLSGADQDLQGKDR